MGLSIRPAVPGDAPALAALLQAVDDHYGEDGAESLAEKVAQIETTLFGAEPRARALLAWDGENLIGVASYSFLWPASRTTKSLYLKELFVLSEHRGRGYGKMLMRELARVALANSCSRLEWTADVASVEAQNFYQALGASQLQSKILYRLDGGALQHALRNWGADSTPDAL